MINIRNCFKYMEKKHIEFCLDKKIGENRPSSHKLAISLGLSKQKDNDIHFNLKER